MSEGDRRCRSCRFYQAAPLAGKGWCRNPVLYAPSQQHLVDGRDIDCQRAFGDFWQAPLDLPEPAVDTLAPGAIAALGAEPPGDAGDAAGLVSTGALATGSTYRGAHEPSRRGVVRAGLIAALVTLISALVGLLALNGMAESRPTIAAVSAVETAVAQPTFGPSPTSQAPAATPTPLASPTLATVPSVAPTSTVERVATVERAATPTPEPRPSVPVVVETPAVPPTVAPRPTQPSVRTVTVTAGKLKVGGQAVVATGANDQRLRMRNAPDLQAEIVGRIGNGARVQVIDGPRQADGETWWRVRHTTGTGWVSGAFMQPSA